MVSRDPSRLGFPLGFARLGVYNVRSAWESQIRKISREVIWRVANMNVDLNTTTGHRDIDYSLTHTINGVFEDRGGSLHPLPSGFIQRGDAVFSCVDGVSPLDQIYLPESQRYYEVQYVAPIFEGLKEQGVTSFVYRACDLKFLDLYMEA